MDVSSRKLQRISRTEWRFTERGLLVILYVFFLVIQSKCQTILKEENRDATKIEKLDVNVDSNHCHSCHTSSSKTGVKRQDTGESQVPNEDEASEGFVDNLVTTLGTFTRDYLLVNKTETQLENEIETLLDDALSKDKYELFEGIEIKSVENNDSKTESKSDVEGRALFPKYSYEYRLYKKVKSFIDTHILSINLPKAARLIGFRCKYY